MSPADADTADLGKLLALVRRLRAADGCPWDRRQGLGDVRAYLLEEAHELAAAIDGGDWDEIAEELGDLLFQAAFIARLGAEAGELSAGAAIDRAHDKMVARHPHVFGDEELADAEAVSRAWERRKAEAAGPGASQLDGVPASLPALIAAYRLAQKAAGVGFDWPDAASVVAKVHEELAEIEAEIAAGAGRNRLREETGDLLFAVANLARKLDLDPEAALAAANAKFRRRFRRVEEGLAARGRAPGEASLDEMEGLWQDAKRTEDSPP